MKILLASWRIVPITLFFFLKSSSFPLHTVWRTGVAVKNNDQNCKSFTSTNSTRFYNDQSPPYSLNGLFNRLYNLNICQAYLTATLFTQQKPLTWSLLTEHSNTSAFFPKLKITQTQKNSINNRHRDILSLISGMQTYYHFKPESFPLPRA